MEITELVQTIREGLAVEQLLQQSQSIEDLIAWQQRRRALKQQLDELAEEVRHLREHYQALRPLPPLGTIRWAQAVAALPNLVFLELDTTSLHQDAEIIRALVLDRTGSPLLDFYGKPSHPLSQQTETLTGLTNEAVMHMGVSQEALVAKVCQSLIGKYVLAYNLEFDQKKLDEAARRFQKEPVPIIGDDLMQHARRYFGTQFYPGLEMACEWVRSPLPLHPQQTATDRANGQCALLQAMANAIVVMPAAEDQNDEEEDIDEHPF